MSNTVINHCHYCDKAETKSAHVFGMAKAPVKLMQCSRCKTALYCSKECQRADYKNHKDICKGVAKVTSFDKSQTREFEFFFSIHYLRIMNAIHRVTQEYSISMKDIVVEVDFLKKGNKFQSPADQGEFSVYPVKQVIEQQPPREPSWLRHARGTKEHKSCTATHVAVLRDAHRRITSNVMILSVIRTKGASSAGRFALSSNAGFVMTSEEALKLFPVTSLAQAESVLKHTGNYTESGIHYVSAKFALFEGNN